MSGNATNTTTRRVSNNEHARALEEVRGQLDALSIPHIPTTWLSDKNSHGDIDVVVSETHWPAQNFSFPGGHGQTSRVGFTHIGWPIKGTNELVQVDFIRIEHEFLEQTKTYLSHGTLGNILGLVCRSIGLRYGMRGLTLVARHPDGQKCGNIAITHDPQECLELLQLPKEDIEKILHGSFPTREDYYPVLTRLPFFHRDVIHPDRMTAPNRGRDKKRPEVTPCRNWMLEHAPEPKWELPNRDDQEAYLKYQSDWQHQLLGDRMPELLEQAAQLSEKIRKAGKTRTDKDIWFEKTAGLAGIPPQELGKSIHQLAKSKKLDVSQFIEKTTPQDAATLLQQIQPEI